MSHAPDVDERLKQLLRDFVATARDDHWSEDRIRDVVELCVVMPYDLAVRFLQTFDR